MREDYDRCSKEADRLSKYLKDIRLRQVIQDFHTDIHVEEVDRQLRGIKPADIIAPPGIQYDLAERAQVAQLYATAAKIPEADQLHGIRVELVRRISQLCSRRESREQRRKYRADLRVLSVARKSRESRSYKDPKHEQFGEAYEADAPQPIENALSLPVARLRGHHRQQRAFCQPFQASWTGFAAVYFTLMQMKTKNYYLLKFDLATMLSPVERHSDLCLPSEEQQCGSIKRSSSVQRLRS
ncbi:hypothetical protein NLG97_g6593 [Lecanicillium saksenae]|uniref:Uncharacterized protein n=1 Tax=Lecanicillium saksenae TaxID=468837 RepID=A0ACC1QR22_9HYPO|nr:hypothetical protein NLG97_g6593 [Lecanicillium saksenae]